MIPFKSIASLMPRLLCRVASVPLALPSVIWWVSATIRGVSLLISLQVASAMLGDAHDLSAAIAWAEEVFWLDSIDEEAGELAEWPYSQATRINIAELVQDLGEAFKASELAHRRAFSLTGNKTETKASPLLCMYRHRLTSGSVEISL